MKQGDEDARPGAPDGVTEGHGAAVDVELLGVDLELAGERYALGGERLVELDEIEVADGLPAFLEQVRKWFPALS